MARETGDEMIDRTAELQGWQLSRLAKVESFDDVRVGDSGKGEKWMVGMIAGAFAVMAVLASLYLRHMPSTEASHVAEQAASDQVFSSGVNDIAAFLEATSSEDKFRHTLLSPTEKDDFKQHYQKHPLDDGLSVSDFTPTNYLLSDQDLKLGIRCFSLQNKRSGRVSFELPETAYSSEEFQKRGPLGFGGKVEAPLLLPRAISVTGQPLVFFRDGRIDWATYRQHLSGSLRTFTAMPNEERGLFRVILLVSSDTNLLTLCDLCHDRVDLGPLVTRPDTSAHQQIADGLAKGTPRTATVRLSWDRSSGTPRLLCEELICWELLGVASPASGS